MRTKQTTSNGFIKSIRTEDDLAHALKCFMPAFTTFSRMLAGKINESTGIFPLCYSISRFQNFLHALNKTGCRWILPESGNNVWNRIRHSSKIAKD
jgi:hypothetical protein